MADATAVTLTCNNCGAQIAVQPGTRYVTCEHCRSQLEVHTDGGAAYTKVLKRLDERTAKLTAEVESIRTQDAISLLEHDLAAETNRDLARTNTVASTAGAIVVTVLCGFMAAFGFFWMFMAKTIGLGDASPLGVVFLIIPAIVLAALLAMLMMDRRRRRRAATRRTPLEDAVGVRKS